MKDESNELTELLKQDEHHNRDFDVSSDLVRQGITKQNAAITNVTAHFRRLSFNKKAEGKCIGTSQHVKCLSIFLHGGDAAGVILFCKGLALNTTIRSLRLIFYADAGEAQVDSDVLFETLLPYFENNANLNRFELCYNGSCWISTYFIQALCSSTSLKQVTVQKLDENITHTEEKLIHELCGNSHLHRLCLKGNLLSEDGCSASFYNPKCSLKSIEINGGWSHSPIRAPSISSSGNLQHIAWGGRSPHSLFKLQSLNFTLTKLDLSISPQSLAVDSMR